ncbi:F-box protein At1g30790-like isoform X3 [Olea europaea var. sylvestris]|uniref:F-box protein At1g30790-like isoform X1 n=1 Tax=Olea europaea var. sylvestris TaxID=158386 RepID=UPI000C1CE49A|nr:F-box protein At1g30790-like isoform X1 [Olea europaea var. sylvestris]XP_022842728.1 F-box protein At1g30790-like isoform X2 [Olea europaea var. sylvestris]XP_022842729.1 F-box protein At1g30790-like isoform X3 [Olea europaea var. sylvestris]
MKGIDDFPRDLIIEILSRLPAKVLCKFRCVSKRWYNLLTNDRDLMTRHSELSKLKPLLLIRKYISDANGEPDRSKVTIELTSIDTEGNITDEFREVLDGPVHTFISCYPFSVLCCMYSLYVCNPSIHQVVRVPYPSNARLYNVGFGHLPKSNEFKIVHLLYHSFVGDGKIGCEIFSFKHGEGVHSGFWRTLGDYPCSAWIDGHPLCLNKAIYWGLIATSWNDKSILSFNLENEEFNVISYPAFDSEKYIFLEYTGIKGCLSLVGCSAGTSALDIWLLKDEKKIWVLEYSISLSPLNVMFLIPCDNQGEELLIHVEQRGLICFSVKNQTCRRVEYCRAMKNFNKPCLYYDSLIPLSSVTHRIEKY